MYMWYMYVEREMFEHLALFYFELELSVQLGHFTTLIIETRIVECVEKYYLQLSYS